MAAGDGFVKVPPDSNGKAIDHSELTVAGQTVERQRGVVADPVDPLALASVKNSAPAGSEYGQLVRPIVSDGLDATQGATTDAAVTSNAAGTISAKLRGLVAILADVWDAAGHTLKVTMSGALAAGANLIGKVGIDQTTPGTTNLVSIGSDGVVAISNAGFAVTGTVQLLAGAASIGAVSFQAGQTVGLAAGAAIVGKFGIDQTTPGATNLVSIGNNGSVTLLAGAANIGSVAIQAGQTLAAVTAITNPLPAGTNILGKIGIDSTVTGGLALEAGNIATILGRTPVLGAAASAASSPVTFATDQVASKSNQPQDTDLGVLIRQIGEDNALTQTLIQQIANLLYKVFGMTAAAGTPALNVNAFQATAASFNVTLAANSTVSVSQVSAVAVANVTGLQAPSVTTQTAALTVAPTQSYHLPLVPMHLYDPGAISV